MKERRHPMKKNVLALQNLSTDKEPGDGVSYISLLLCLD
jgi:hypothetical protein